LEERCKIKTGKIIKIIAIVLILIVLVLVLIRVTIKNEEVYKQTSSSISIDSENINENNILLSKEQQHKGINEVKTVIDNKSDEIVLIIDGENINKKEIEFVDFKMNTNEGNEDVIKRIIEDYVILKNAEETGEVLSKEENEAIENIIKEKCKQR
jgi:hypothetical protein